MLADDEAAERPPEPLPVPIPGPFHRLLLSLDAERAHGLALTGLRLAAAVPGVRSRLESRHRVDDPRLEQDLLGTRFPNPVGLAAGFDKDALAVPGFGRLGFGFVEVGTVTPRPQPGNPRPRLFRHPDHASLQNAMGFNNRGLEALAARIEKGDRRIPLGVNMGRNKDTAPEEAAEDYRRIAGRLSGQCDYFVVNVSSPNTPGLRDLQERDRLAGLLAAVAGATTTPFLVKLSPDLEPGEAVVLAEASLDAGAAGIVLTNTTIDYSVLPGSAPPGGLSGRVLRERSFQMLRAVGGRIRGRGVLISVGGIETPEEAYRRLRHGAALVQVYTALVYHGPGLVRYLNEGLLRLLERDGAGGVDEIVGADA